MRNNFTLFRVVIVTILLVVVISQAAAQSKPYRPDYLLKIAYTECINAIRCENGMIQVFPDGSYIAEREFYEWAKSGIARRVKATQEKQLENMELSELVAIAEPEFWKSGPEYILKRGQEHKNHMKVTFHHNGRETDVVVADFNESTVSERARIPTVILRLLKWARPELFQAASH